MSQFKRITEGMKPDWHDYHILYPRYFVGVILPIGNKKYAIVGRGKLK